MVVTHGVTALSIDLFFNNRSQIISTTISTLCSLDNAKHLERNTLRKIFKRTEFGRRNKFFAISQRNFGIISVTVVRATNQSKCCKSNNK